MRIDCLQKFYWCYEMFVNETFQFWLKLLTFPAQCWLFRLWCHALIFCLASSHVRLFVPVRTQHRFNVHTTSFRRYIDVGWMLKRTDRVLITKCVESLEKKVGVWITGYWGKESCPVARFFNFLEATIAADFQFYTNFTRPIVEQGQKKAKTKCIMLSVIVIIKRSLRAAKDVFFYFFLWRIHSFIYMIAEKKSASSRVSI